jgi:hypothetical protein
VQHLIEKEISFLVGMLEGHDNFPKGYMRLKILVRGAEICGWQRKQSQVTAVMNNTCIHLRGKGLNIYMYRRGRIYKEPPGEI